MPRSLRDQNVELIHQGLVLLRELSDDVYSASPEGTPEAPRIGPHFRHCIDFYTCFLEGLALRVVDYGSRPRRREVERRRGAAIEALESVATRLADLDPGLAAEALQLRREPSADGDDEEWLGSTVGRELQFLASHTIHHYALIALALRLADHPVPEDFGVAPSTLEHWRREGRITR